MKKNLYISICLLLVFFMISCDNTKEEEFNEEEYKIEIQNWKSRRIERLKADDGWLNLVGLHWIDEGINIFGSNSENEIIFPEDTPEQIGAIIKFKGNLSISVNDSVEVFVNDTIIKDYEIHTDTDDNMTHFKMGKYKWHIINRNGKYAIRLRDLKNPLINALNEIPAYPVNTKWRIKAEYQPYANPIQIEIANVLGSSDIENCYGSLNFKIDSIEYELLPLGNGKKESLFLIFADETSTNETYGGGRYLSIEKPDSSGKVFIDFNKATNPPCAFTEFATCPLPPKENIINIKVTAGEKKVNILKEH